MLIIFLWIFDFQGAPLDLIVTVGSSSMWPMSQANQTNGQPKSSCILPRLLDDSIKLYERFYSTRHSGRRLNWHTELGNLEIKIKFKKTTHELNLSTLAGIVVLLFDGAEEGQKFTYPVRLLTAGDSFFHVEMSWLTVSWFLLPGNPSGDRDVRWGFEADTAVVGVCKV